MTKLEQRTNSKAACAELQRISEVLPNAYFQADDDKPSNPDKRKVLLALECELQGLDAEAWEFLRSEARHRVKAPRPLRGWQQLFDTLNEAKGYNYLVSIDCENVKFIPRAKNDKETPDLRGFLGATEVLCEVKTINKSYDEVKRFATGGVGTTLPYLVKGFFDKLSSDIQKASSQLLAFNNNSAARRIVYVVFNFDDYLHQCADEYQKQIEAHIKCAALPNVEVVLDIWRYEWRL